MLNLQLKEMYLCAYNNLHRMFRIFPLIIQFPSVDLDIFGVTQYSLEVISVLDEFFMETFKEIFHQNSAKVHKRLNYQLTITHKMLGSLLPVQWCNPSVVRIARFGTFKTLSPNLEFYGC